MKMIYQIIASYCKVVKKVFILASVKNILTFRTAQNKSVDVNGDEYSD